MRKESDSGINGIGDFARIPPHDISIEQAVIGAVILEHAAYEIANEIITSNDFYDINHQKIWSAIHDLKTKGGAVDLLIITEELTARNQIEQIGGAYYLTSLTMAVVSSAHIQTHAIILHEKYLLRELIRLSNEVIQKAYNNDDVFEIFDIIEKRSTQLMQDIQDNNLQTTTEVIKTVNDELETIRNSDRKIHGINTGFIHLNKMTNGWQKGNLIILAARPSVGKSAFVSNLALNAASDPNNPTGVLVFSLEMENREIMIRMISSVSRVNMEKIKLATYTPEEWIKITDAENKIMKMKIILQDKSQINIQQLRSIARKKVAKGEIGLIIIDYLQLMGMMRSDQNLIREQQISSITRNLKALAKELRVPIILLSQLSREVEKRGNPRPVLSDLRESGAIEQDADLVMFLTRENYQKCDNEEADDEDVLLIIAKNRNGKCVDLPFKADLTIQAFFYRDEWEAYKQIDPFLNYQKYSAPGND